MPINKTFELLGGDLVQTPMDTRIVLSKTTWGGMILRDTVIDSNDLQALQYTSRDWIRWLDEYYGRAHWTLYRRIGPAEWIPLPRTEGII